MYNTFVYNPASHLTTRTDAKGYTTTFYYNDTGNVTREVDPLGQEIRTTSDTAYNKTGVTNAHGQAFAFAYDGYGRRVRKEESYWQNSNQHWISGRSTAADRRRFRRRRFSSAARGPPPPPQAP